MFYTTDCKEIEGCNTTKDVNVWRTVECSARGTMILVESSYYDEDEPQEHNLLLTHDIDEVMSVVKDEQLVIHDIQIITPSDINLTKSRNMEHVWKIHQGIEMLHGKTVMVITVGSARCYVLSNACPPVSQVVGLKQLMEFNVDQFDEDRPPCH